MKNISLHWLQGVFETVPKSPVQIVPNVLLYPVSFKVRMEVGGGGGWDGGYSGGQEFMQILGRKDLRLPYRCLLLARLSASSSRLSASSFRWISVATPLQCEHEDKKAIT